MPPGNSRKGERGVTNGMSYGKDSFVGCYDRNHGAGT